MEVFAREGDKWNGLGYGFGWEWKLNYLVLIYNEFLIKYKYIKMVQFVEIRIIIFLIFYLYEILAHYKDQLYILTTLYLTNIINRMYHYHLSSL